MEPDDFTLNYIIRLLSVDELVLPPGLLLLNTSIHTSLFFLVWGMSIILLHFLSNILPHFLLNTGTNN